MSSHRFGLPQLPDYELFRSKSRHHSETSGHTEKPSPARYKRPSSAKSRMESTDITGCSKARDLDHRPRGASNPIKHDRIDEEKNDVTASARPLEQMDAMSVDGACVDNQGM